MVMATIRIYILVSPKTCDAPRLSSFAEANMSPASVNADAHETHPWWLYCDAASTHRTYLCPGKQRWIPGLTWDLRMVWPLNTWGCSWYEWWLVDECVGLGSYHLISGWWFGTFFIFPYIGNSHPNWLIFLRGVETTNQQWNIYEYVYRHIFLHSYIVLDISNTAKDCEFQNMFGHVVSIGPASIGDWTT